MAVTMAVRGRFAAPFASVIGRVTETPVVATPADTILLCRKGELPGCDLAAFAAVLLEDNRASPPRHTRIGVYDNLDHLHAGDVVQIDGRSGRTRTLYRKLSCHNVLFVTERCNSNCLMCSQPPKADGDEHLDVCIRMVELLKDDPPAVLGITGGEPTLLDEGFLHLIRSLKELLPRTLITVLSNGRTFSDPAFATAIGAISHARLRFSVPLHADVADVHDYIAQARGAFSETIAGLYNLAASGVAVEIRVVLHNLSVPRLVPLAEYIWRKLPFIEQVAFMGLENMGYVKKNWNHLWIDPADYGPQLRSVVTQLWLQGIGVSIYNLPFCVLPQSIWGFVRQSISDHKQTFVEQCGNCDVSSHCAGFFVSSTERHSRGIRPITVTGAAISASQTNPCLP